MDAPLATKVGFDGWHSVLEWNQLCGPEDGLTDREKKTPDPFYFPRFDPGNPANPLNRFNSNNPFNPVNEYNPKNPLNPTNEYNSSVPFGPLNSNPTNPTIHH